MEMLAAMMSGAVGGVLARRIVHRKRGLWVATLLGILGGGAAWWVLGAIGPAPKAGPLMTWHMGAGALAGAALASLGLMLARRAG
ncbi:hypothetical protein [Roseovarius aquimarinus]|uniref:Transglycosylase associated protein n=1 Tax=Roseovarius aquimarinus TaxID=1229156 RepID=A0ABW7I5T1_9RHOB